MKTTATSLSIIAMVGILLAATNAFSDNYTRSEVGVGGYDIVAYHTQGKATRGTGWHAAVHDGTTYLFSSKENRALFVKNPDRYLPKYGGFCAFGAAMGKKFYADPTVWKIVDGNLYLNLDPKIQNKFVSDLSGNIAKADENWPELRDRNPEGI